MAEIAFPRELLERNVAELARLDERLGQRDTCITELGRLLSGSGVRASVRRPRSRRETREGRRRSREGEAGKRMVATAIAWLL